MPEQQKVLFLEECLKQAPSEIRARRESEVQQRRAQDNEKNRLKPLGIQNKQTKIKKIH